MTPGKKALITGGSSPLAIDLGLELFNQGYSVYLTSRSSKYLDLAKKTFPCTLFTADMTTHEGRSCVMQKIEKEAFDLVINSAGLGFYGNTLDLEDSDLQQMCTVNMLALALFSKAAAEAMRIHQKEGIIVNISSATDQLVYPSFAVYAASKSFVTAFSLAFAQEVLPFNISVLVAAPGQLQTRFQQRASKGFYAAHNGLATKKAAQEIIRMIEKKQRYRVFPWSTRVYRCIFLWLCPKQLRYYLLKRSLRHRIFTKKPKE